MKTPLTVEQLIKKLELLPKDMYVLAPDMEQRKSDYYEVFDVKVIEAVVDNRGGIRGNDFIPFEPEADIKKYVLLDWS